MSVHAYGIETRADLGIRPAKGWLIDAGASFSWTPSINAGEPVSAADKSPGKQLPYVPKRSASATLRVSHCGWSYGRHHRCPFASVHFLPYKHRYACLLYRTPFSRCGCRYFRASGVEAYRAASWEHFAEKWKSTIRGGYIYSQTAYDYSRDAGGGNMTAMTRARSYVNSLYGHAEGEYTPVRNLNLSISLSARQHFVRSHDKSLSTPSAPESRTIGFNARRAEISAAASCSHEAAARRLCSRCRLSKDASSP